MQLQRLLVQLRAVAPLLYSSTAASLDAASCCKVPLLYLMQLRAVVPRRPALVLHYLLHVLGGTRLVKQHATRLVSSNAAVMQ